MRHTPLVYSSNSTFYFYILKVFGSKFGHGGFVIIFCLSRWIRQQALPPHPFQFIGIYVLNGLIYNVHQGISALYQLTAIICHLISWFRCVKKLEMIEKWQLNTVIITSYEPEKFVGSVERSIIERTNAANYPYSN